MANPTVETACLLALRARVATLSLSPALPVLYMSPAASGPISGYLLVQNIRNRTLRPLIGSSDPHHYRGILQIDVMSRLNQDEAVATEIAGDVADHFPADLELTAEGVTLRIVKHPDVGPTMAQDKHLKTPVSVEYETYQ